MQAYTCTYLRNIGTHLGTYISTCLCIHTQIIYIYIYIYIYTFVHTSTHPSTEVFIHSYIHLSKQRVSVNGYQMFCLPTVTSLPSRTLLIFPSIKLSIHHMSSNIFLTFIFGLIPYLLISFNLINKLEV